MSEELRSVAVWTVVFLILELPAHFGLVPWLTLSLTVWNGESWWPPVAAFVAAFVLVLLAHLEFHWSARWLVLTALAGAAVIASHLVERSLR